MIEIVGIIKDVEVKRTFDSVYDATEFRDILDANYAKVEWRDIEEEFAGWGS